MRGRPRGRAASMSASSSSSGHHPLGGEDGVERHFTLRVRGDARTSSKARAYSEARSRSTRGAMAPRPPARRRLTSTPPAGQPLLHLAHQLGLQGGKLAGQPHLHLAVLVVHRPDLGVDFLAAAAPCPAPNPVMLRIMGPPGSWLAPSRGSPASSSARQPAHGLDVQIDHAAVVLQWAPLRSMVVAGRACDVDVHGALGRTEQVPRRVGRPEDHYRGPPESSRAVDKAGVAAHHHVAALEQRERLRNGVAGRVPDAHARSLRDSARCLSLGRPSEQHHRRPIAGQRPSKARVLGLAPALRRPLRPGTSPTTGRAAPRSASSA